MSNQIGAALADDQPVSCAQHRGGQHGIPHTVKLSFYIGAAAFFGTILWTVLSTKEHPPEDMQAFKKLKAEGSGLMGNVREIGKAIAGMPQTMRRLAWVQVCTWLGLFCMWLAPA